MAYHENPQIRQKLEYLNAEVTARLPLASIRTLPLDILN